MNNCRQKYIIVALLVLLFGSSQVHSQPDTASFPTETAKKEKVQDRSTIAREKELLEKKEKAVELQLKNIELEREIIVGQYRNLDFALKLLAVFLSVVSIAITLFGLFGYKNIKKYLKDTIQKEFSDKTQKTIETTIRSTSEKPILELTETVNRIDNELEDLKDAFQSQTGTFLPSYKKKSDDEPTENVFDQNDNP
jgi:uncharacterized membrane protein YidH (DUF202 family)